ncbi:hypothetical protein C2I18_24665 [Paenibacillus sp. PK3_47]|nr:hypothetical protein C2I18_24665 [Paenibacillus sp. PK3_47]
MHVTDNGSGLGVFHFAGIDRCYPEFSGQLSGKRLASVQHHVAPAVPFMIIILTIDQLVGSYAPLF